MSAPVSQQVKYRHTVAAPVPGPRKGYRDMGALLGIAVALTPLAVVVVLLKIADGAARRRQGEVARQIELTDEIHRELGAVAAPTVERGPGGAWIVTMRVPLERPGTVAALLRITHRVFARTAHAPLRVVLTHDAPPLYTHERLARARPAPSLAA